MTMRKQKCTKCSRTIAGDFESIREWIAHLKAQGWVMAFFGWVCPEHAKNVPEGERV